MKQGNEEKIIDILEKILKVVSLQVASDKSITERVNLLTLAEVDNKTIARVLNISEASVRALASRSKRSSKK